MRFTTKLLLTILCLAIPMFAAPIVTFTTTGIFSQSGTAVATFGTGTLTFVPGGGTVDLGLLNPSNANFGSIDASGFDGIANTISGTLTVDILQTLPASGSGLLVGTLSGSLTGNASSGHVMFTTTTVTLPPGIQYIMVQPATGVPIVPPTTNGGMTTLQGDITTVPEPGMFGLIGTVLVGLGIIRRRLC